MKMLSLITRRLAFAWLFIGLTALANEAAPRVDHFITIGDPKSQTIKVMTEIKEIKQAEITVGIASWMPGYYTIVDFVRNIEYLTFTDEQNRPLPHRKSHDSLWTIVTNGASAIKIQFTYNADKLDLNNSLVGSSYAVLNGANFLFYVKDHTRDFPATLTLKLPEGWKAATGLTPAQEPLKFQSESYEELIDCPLLVGEFDLTSFRVRDVPIDLVTAPRGVLTKEEIKQLTDGYIKLFEAQSAVFGEIPFNRYVALKVFQGEDEPRGLEHANSDLAILPSRSEDRDEDINSILELASHEIFHAYNVKRLRPAEMWPYRYHERNYTPLLWFVEGITDYYTWRGLLRAGLRDSEAFLKKQESVINSVNSTEAANYISLEESSINTWLGEVGGSGQRFSVDYYLRGHVVGLLLDASIRGDTKGTASLDHLMHNLYQAYYKKGAGFTTKNLIDAINKLTGMDYHPFFSKYVSGTAPLPYNEMLQSIGLRVDLQTRKEPQLGFGSGPDKKIAIVVPGSAAEQAGAKIGDVFLGIGEFDSDNPQWGAQFRAAYAQKDGETIPLRILRDDKPMSLNLKVRLGERSKWNVVKISQPSELQKKLFDAWLKGL